MSKRSRREARRHIERIGAGYVTKTNDPITKALTEAIKVLSDELYGNATHFIQELLQNSDDNSYDCPDPTITFTYRPGSLRVDCNENGFTSANVDAICAIRSSTKAGNSNYTGEKGIGFKSVFRAADIVWVASREYRFKFDRSQRFGILSPTWAEFPEQELHKQDHTSFYLKLSPSFNEKELVTELSHFDPAQLVFMRRLRKVHIRIYPTQNAELPWEQTIHRSDSNHGSNVSLDLGDSKQQYMIHKHKLTNLPSDSKRPDNTRLVLAFPITDVTVEPPYQKVYAGLPIGETEMYKFLLHGDFILTANRSDIDASLTWNQAVRDGLPEALLRAIRNLRNGSLRHTWPVVLEVRNEGFLKSPLTVAMKQMRKEECLESYVEGHLAKPADLAYVNKTLCDSDGQPFTMCSSTAARYLCTNYPPMTIDVIRDLGVRDLTRNDFLKDLHQMISAEPVKFQSRPLHWHSELCKALFSFVEDRELRDSLSKIPIIPLSNGGWAAASDYPKPVLERGNIELDDFQMSDIFPTVDRSAATCEHRKTLFAALGIEPFDTSQLCQRICKEHSSPDFDAEKWSREQLIVHANLLYRHNWSPPDEDVDLWFATSCNRRCKGSKLYLEGDYEAMSPPARIFHLVQQTCPIIHPDYQTTFFNWAPNPYTSGLRTWLYPTDDLGTLYQNRWITYLMERLHVSKIPRLVDITTSPTGKKTFVLSDVFKYIFENGRIEDVISLLEENWSFYSKWIDPDALQEQSKHKRIQTAQLTSAIGNVIIQTSQRPTPLRATFM